MAVSGRRSRSVSFRLSEQEYRALLEVCQTQGARCVSEAVRNVIHSLLSVNGRGNRVKTKSDTTSGTPVKNMLVQLQGRLEDLEGELKRLTTAVGQLLQANSLAEPELSTTTPHDVEDSGLAQLTDAIGHVPGGPRKP